MKPICLFVVLISYFCFSSCSKTPDLKAKVAIQTYLEENLNNPGSYKSISFSRIENLKFDKNSKISNAPKYKITHAYSILNSDKDKVKMIVPFYLDDKFNVKEKELYSINGDYGLLEIIDK